MSRELHLCPGVGNGKCGTFLFLVDRDPHPTCTRCRGKICTRDLTCDFCVGWSPAQWELFVKKRTYKDRKKSRPSGSLRPTRELLRKFRNLGLPPLLFPSLQVGRIRGGWSVSGCSSVARERASVSSAPSGAGDGEVARSQQTPPARSASSVASPRSSQHAWRRDELREILEGRSFSRSSCVSWFSDRGTRKDRRARSRSDSSRDRGRRSRSRSASCSRLAVVFSVAVLPQAVTPCAVAIFGSLPLPARTLSLRPVSILGSMQVSAWPVAIFWLLPITSTAFPCSPGSSRWSPSLYSWPLAVSWTIPSLLWPYAVKGERTVSQKWAAGGCEDGQCLSGSCCLWSACRSHPSVGGATLATLPSAVQDLARFFLNLTGSSTMERAWLLQHRELWFSCAFRLLVVVQSHLCCDCGSCGVGWSSCFRCCARVSGRRQRQETLSTQQASPSLVQWWDRQSVDEASEGSVYFPWSFFSPLGEALSVVFRVLGGCPSRGFSSKSWTCAWRYSWRFSPCSGGWPLASS